MASAYDTGARTKGGLGCRARRPPDAENQYPVRLSPQRHRTEVIRNEGFHHPGGSQQAFLTGLAHLYYLVPYQRRVQHAGQCGVEVEGGRVPTTDWFLKLQILTSGGFQ